MSTPFADRMARAHKSYITEILRVTENPGIISFAGGLPNSQHFPVAEIAEAASRVLAESGQSALQYATTQGYPPLRVYIAERYWNRYGIKIDPSEVLITNGSQQGFDLVAKTLLNRGDRVVLERPAYHGAIQAFALYEPEFVPVPLLPDGIDTEALDAALSAGPAKLFYSVPSFQNPSGLTYSREKRVEVARILNGHNVLLVEDDPYGELRFEGEDLAPIKLYYHDNGILLGTFSKTVAPGLRIGWICARGEIMAQLMEAKQACDLHSDFLAQRILHRYLTDNDLDSHVRVLREAYRQQRDFMLYMIEKYIPPQVSHTVPEGGMFIFLRLPEGLSALRLFDIATRENVAFVPGRAFQVDGGGDDTMRLSFSSSDRTRTEEGMRRLGAAMQKLLAESRAEVKTARS